MSLTTGNHKPKLTVLLIEDNPGDARLLQVMLAEVPAAPFALERADRLSTGLERLDKGGIDLVLLDLSLPDSGGIDTFVRAHEHAPHVPLIVLSGLDDEDFAIKTVQEGAQDYLVKGRYDSHLLVRAMRYAVERKRAEEQLARYAEELGKKNAQMEADLDMAREIQQVFLPQARQYPVLPRGAAPEKSALRFCHRYYATEAVGGDFCQIIGLSDTTAAVFICDVMGHGVRAALVTAMARALVEELKPVAGDPGRFLTEINRGLIEILRTTRTPMFASAFHIVADVATGQLRYANAGHLSPLHVQRGAGIVEPLPLAVEASGPALGVFEEAVYTTSSCQLAARDLIVLFTDGLCEVAGPSGQYYDEWRMMAAVRQHINLPQEVLFDELMQEIQQFSATQDFEDDVCLVGMEVAWLERRGQGGER